MHKICWILTTLKIIWSDLMDHDECCAAVAIIASLLLGRTVKINAIQAVSGDNLSGSNPKGLAEDIDFLNLTDAVIK